MGFDIVSLVPDFCEVFLGAREVDGGLAFPKRIDRDGLDFSVRSLKAVDRYLDVLHERADRIEEQQYTNSVLAAGCYLGEVIREHATARYKWMNYADYFPRHPDLARMAPEGLGTGAVLVSKTGMLMPINKIIRYIEEGPENSTHYFASCEVRGERR
jgi:hypothetical protein